MPRESSEHVDRISVNPLVAGRDEKLIARFRSIDDPRIGGQERQGWATYVYISEPHTMADCPFGSGPVLELERPVIALRRIHDALSVGEPTNPGLAELRVVSRRLAMAGEADGLVQRIEELREAALDVVRIHQLEALGYGTASSERRTLAMARLHQAASGHIQRDTEGDSA